LRARDFISVQPARNAHLDSLAAETLGRVHAFSHGAAEANPLLELQSYVLRNQLRVQFRLVHLDDVDEHFPASALAQLTLQLLDFRTLATDHDARPRCADQKTKFVARPL